MKTVGSGSECTVFRTEKGILKCYESKSEAKMACTIQRNLAHYDLAPYVLEGARRRKIDGVYLWGYYSEEAEPLPICDCEDLDCYCYMETQEARDFVCEMVEYWCGLEFTDAHQGNFGFINRLGSKTLAVIDCGHKGFCSTREEASL